MKKTVSAPLAHAMAIFTVIVWGTTFIASKLLLEVYSPVQIMLLRFALAYISLLILRPKLIKTDLRSEGYFALLGIFGCTVYFLTENTALQYTLAANVSILVAASPIFTAILANLVFPDEKLGINTFLGFGIAFAGVALVVFNGAFILKLGPKGDLLSICAALCWAVYSVLLKRGLGRFDSIVLTRRIMLYGFITSLPIALAEGKPFSLAPLGNGKLLFCVLFLGVIGSGLCFVLWSLAMDRLGVVVTNNYVYVNPFSTMIAAGLVLDERISAMGIIGSAFILLGVFIADRKKLPRLEETSEDTEIT
jgi:drug/metabolite transporter (DMT)-like permease